MKISRNQFVLAVIPVAMLLLAASYALQRTYYFGFNSDPEYAYLFNALNIFNFTAPSHTDHPGTPLQVLGAVVIFFKGLTDNMSFSSEIIQNSVLRNPEDYLHAINLVLNVLVCLITFVTGLKLLHATQKLLPALTLQFSLLCFFAVPFSLLRVCAEPLLVFTALLLILVLIPEVFADLVESPGQGSFKRPALAGAVLGLGIATKLTFFPLLWLVLIFDGLRKRSFAIISCIASFIICTLPIFSKYATMFGWFAAVATHQGKHGNGPSGLPETGTLLSNAKSLCLAEPALFLLLLIYVLFAVIIKYDIFKLDALSKKRIQKLLWSGYLVLFTQIIITAKHPGAYYMLPSMVIACFMNAGLVYFFSKTDTRQCKVARIALFAVLIAAATYNIVNVNSWVRKDQAYTTMSNELLSKAGSFQDTIKVGFYRSSLPEFALFFGNQWSGKKYGKELAKLYPSMIFYKPKRHFFYSFEGPVDKEYVKAAIKKGSGVIMIGTFIRPEDSSGFILQPLYSNSREGIYRLIEIH